MTNEAVEREIDRLRNPDILQLEQVKRFGAWVDDRRKLGQPGRAVGNTGLGKTSAAMYYTFRNRASNQPNQSPVVPILYIEMRGSSCSPILLFENILKTLKHKATGGNENQLRKRAWDKLRQCKVEVLIIDEAHRLQFKTLPDVTDLQKELGILPILIGTSSRLDTLLSKDEQVASRFACYFNFEELSGGKFRQIVKVWEEQILMLPEPSNLATNEEVISLLQEKTSGQLRLLDQILRNAAIKALESGLNKIDKSVLDSIEGDYSLVAS
jgi:DNA transposition AAA+ family ATPase